MIKLAFVFQGINLVRSQIPRLSFLKHQSNLALLYKGVNCLALSVKFLQRTCVLIWISDLILLLLSTISKPETSNATLNYESHLVGKNMISIKIKLTFLPTLVIKRDISNIYIKKLLRVTPVCFLKQQTKDISWSTSQQKMMTPHSAALLEKMLLLAKCSFKVWSAV